ncbi:MAG: zinc-binding dehydrogenase [Actinomycetaceae bacterium]|nr:zinc-binding dehydrogenase [Actinomycetaceae bacterium]
MTSMRAIVIDGPGGPEALHLRDIPRPTPAPGEVLIRIEAFGLNRSEQHFRKGMASFGSFPRVPGLEAVGTIVSAPGTDLVKGTQVAALMGGMGRLFDGGYAEYCCTPAENVIPFHSDLPWEILGAVPEMLQTAYGSLTIGVGAQPKNTILIRGATSSIGLMCLSLCAQRGITTIATTRREENIDLLRAAGATHSVIDSGHIAPEVIALTNGKGADGAIELVGTQTLKDTVAALHPGATACFTGMLSDTWTIENFNPMDLLPNGHRLTAYSGQARDLPASVLQDYLDSLARGDTAPVHATVFNGLEQVRAAHEAMDANVPGKKVVRVRHADAPERGPEPTLAPQPAPPTGRITR